MAQCEARRLKSIVLHVTRTKKKIKKERRALTRNKISFANENATTAATTTVQPIAL